MLTKISILAIFLVIICLIAGLFFVFSQRKVIEINLTKPNIEPQASEAGAWVSPSVEPESSQGEEVNLIEVLEPSYVETPGIVKGLYYTNWIAARQGFLSNVLNLAQETTVNTLVIDIKDFSGRLAFVSQNSEVAKYQKAKPIIQDIFGFIDELHKAGIYVIARLAVFQDPVLALKRPDLALHSKDKLTSSGSFLPEAKSEEEVCPRADCMASSMDVSAIATSADTLWLDNADLAWIDPASEEAWDYYAAIAQETLKFGFDEINFDYIRFPSDGDLKDIAYPFWDAVKLKREVIRDFFAFLRENLPNAVLSVDLFGYTAVTWGDVGIGQYLEDSFLYFDYLCPMAYPSHYAVGFLGFFNPADYPYEVVFATMRKAQNRLDKFKIEYASSTNSAVSEVKAQIRPWLQDFDLGADYTADMINLEIQAVKDALADNYNGFMLWNSLNVYTKEALEEVVQLEIEFTEPKKPQVCFQETCFEVEVVETPEDRARGLMFRESLPENEGMLFIFEQEDEHSFWMKNTLIPLDMIWLNSEQEAVFIFKDARPCGNEQCLSIKPDANASYVLEINAGLSESLGIQIGDKMVFHLD